MAISADKFFALAMFLETALIVMTAVVTGLSYHVAVHDYRGPALDFFFVGVMVALFYSVPNLFHSHYNTRGHVPGERGYVHLFGSWNFAFLCIAALGFLTKTTSFQSRGWLILFYAIGFGCIALFEGAMDVCRRAAIRSGWLTTRRLLVMGAAGDVEGFARNGSLSPSGITIAATVLTPAPDIFAQEIETCVKTAIDAARAYNVTDIVVLTDWANAPRSAKVAEKLMDAPVAVHLGGLGVVEEFSQLGVGHLGTATTLILRHQPLGILRALAKRGFDIGVSAVALLALAPAFMAVAVLIKYDSRGSVFFRQRRRGFNHKEFRIWKFRTMTTADDGEVIVQASQDDTRVTRVGRILRKWNIDELPQVINVLKGEMSLVGPRPHAVAHDGYYERIIERYARRLNVRPGITGWAQINGHRGPTQTQSVMQARLTHDLFYIEHCSLALDIYILVMTVLSRKAFRNAY